MELGWQKAQSGWQRLSKLLTAAGPFLGALALTISGALAEGATPESCEASILGPITSTHEDSIRNIMEKDANPEEASHRLQSIFGLQFMMYKLGKTADGSIKLEKSEPGYSFMEKRNRELIARLPEKVSPEVEALVERSLNLQRLADGTVIVSVDAEDWYSNHESDGQQKRFRLDVQQRFAQMYQSVAAFVYQLSGLEKSSAITSAKMLDERFVYLYDGKQFDFYLMFDPATWQVQMRILEMLWQQGFPQNATEFDEVHMFLPFAGITVARPTRNRGPQRAVVEMKRYFKNDLEDPFGLLSISPKNDFILRHRLILSVLQSLQVGTTVEIHSHTRTHTVAYRRLGFQVVSHFVNPKFPDATVDLLQAPREVVIDKITRLLNAPSAAPEAHSDNSREQP